MNAKAKRRALLLLLSGVAAAVLVAADVTYWWVWGVWGLVVCCQVAVALGLDGKARRQPPRYVPVRQRPDYAARLAAFEADREHQRRVEEWRRSQAD